MKSAKMFGVVGLAILLFVLVGCTAESGISVSTALGDELALTLGKVTNFVEQVSPLIWETTVAQAKLEAIVNLFWGALLLGFAVVGTFTAKWSIKKHQLEKNVDPRSYNDEWSMLSALVICCVAVAFIAGGTLLSAGFKMALNPEYYAIQKLLLVLG